MKMIRKTVSILLIFVFFTLPLAGCVKDVEEVKPAKVELTNTEETFGVGEHTLSAKVTPSGAKQDVIFSLITPVSGITISGSSLKIAATVKDKQEFEVKAAAKEDSAISAAKKFKVANSAQVAITSVSITNSNSVLMLGRTELIAKVLPITVSQEVTYSLKAPAVGVSIDGNEIVVAAAAVDKTIVTVVATSVLDETKSGEKEFKILKAGVVAITQVSITNTNTVLRLGSTQLTSQVLPLTATQDVTYSLKSPVAGVSISGNNIVVSETAVDDTKVTVVATSVEDTEKFGEKEFTIFKEEVQIAVESVSITNVNTVLRLGDNAMSAEVIPLAASQEVVFTLKSQVTGVSVSGDKVIVEAIAEDEAIVTVVATSAADSSKFDEMEFAILKSEDERADVVVAAVGATFAIPFMENNDWTVEVGSYADEKSLTGVTYEADIALNNAESFAVAGKAYRITYTRKTEPRQKNYLYVAGVDADKIESINPLHCEALTIPNKNIAEAAAAAESEQKFLRSSVIKLTGTVSDGVTMFGTLWNSGVYNDLNNIKIFAYNASEEDVLMTVNAERANITLASGMWTGVNLAGDTFKWCSDNHGLAGSQSATGYRVGNEWKFRFWFNAQTNTEYDVRLAIVLDKGTLQPPQITLEQSVLMGTKDEAVSVPVVDGATWEIFYNNAAFTGAQTDTAFTPNAYGKYEIRYSKVVGDLTATAVCSVLVENPANAHAFTLDSLSACNVAGVVGTNYSIDEQFKLFGKNTLKLTGSSNDLSDSLIGLSVNSGITADFKDLTIYIKNTSSQTIKTHFFGTDARWNAEIKPNEVASIYIDKATVDYFNGSTDPLAHTMKKNSDNVWIFKPVFYVAHVQNYQINVALVINQ